MRNFRYGRLRTPPPPTHTPQKCQNKETSKQNKWEGNITRFMNDLFFISKIEKKKDC